jgi:hypothetical protein
MPKVTFVDDSTGSQVFLEIQANYSDTTITKSVLRELKLDKSAQNAEFFNGSDGSLLTTFSTLRDGDTVLVRITEPSDPYKGLSHTEKRDAIRSKPFTGVEVTLHPDNIHALLEALRTTQTKLLPTTYPASASLDLINQNWGIDMAFFPPPTPLYPDARTFRPTGDAATWDLRLLAALAILSEFTPGQGSYMGTQMNSAVELRNADWRVKKKNWVVTEVDVRRVIKELVREVKEDVSYATLVMRFEEKSVQIVDVFWSSVRGKIWLGRGRQIMMRRAA